MIEFLKKRFVPRILAPGVDIHHRLNIAIRLSCCDSLRLFQSTELQRSYMSSTLSTVDI